jgi:hypothetical protein
MGSVSTIAPAAEPATTAPSAQASRSASKVAEPLSTDLRCSGDPPAMYTKRAPRTAAAMPGSSAEARSTTIRPST